MKILVTLILIIGYSYCYSQPNCNIFLLANDKATYNACEFVTNHKNDYYQFDWRQMEIWEKAIEMSPRLAYPMREFGVPYLKAGNFVKWKIYIDKAVKLDPHEYLGVRGSLKCKFVADYEGAIKDIDDYQLLLSGNDIGPSHDGTYHLNIINGLSYKALGKIDKAIEVFEEQMTKRDHMLGSYDMLHLGVLYTATGNYNKAIEQLNNQINEYDIAENRYYLAKAYRGLGEQLSWQKHIQIAKEYILNNRTMEDSYNELFDKVYIEDIEHELNKEWR